jgi:hypothetical protein
LVSPLFGFPIGPMATCLLRVPWIFQKRIFLTNFRQIGRKILVELETLPGMYELSHSEPGRTRRWSQGCDRFIILTNQDGFARVSNLGQTFAEIPNRFRTGNPLHNACLCKIHKYAFQMLKLNILGAIS